MTDRPWPEGTRPTPGALLEWLRQPGSVVHAGEALEVLDRLLTASEQAERCLIEDHATALAHHYRDRLLDELLDHRHPWDAPDADPLTDLTEAKRLLEEDPDDR